MNPHPQHLPVPLHPSPAEAASALGRPLYHPPTMEQLEPRLLLSAGMIDVTAIDTFEDGSLLLRVNGGPDPNVAYQTGLLGTEVIEGSRLTTIDRVTVSGNVSAYVGLTTGDDALEWSNGSNTTSILTLEYGREATLNDNGTPLDTSDDYWVPGAIVPMDRDLTDGGAEAFEFVASTDLPTHPIDISLYVESGINEGSPQSATVTEFDVATVDETIWQQVQMPFTSFGSVNMADVDYIRVTLSSDATAVDGNIDRITTVAPETPAIDIEKATNAADPMNPTPAEDADTVTGPYIPVGGPVTWTYLVTNTGNVALGSVVVTDDNGTPGDTSDDFNPTFTGGDTDNDDLLDLDEVWTYTGALPGGAVAGQYENISSVEGNPVDENGDDIPDLPNVTDTDPSHYFGALPDIDIEKATNGEDADDPTGPYIPVGNTVTWTYVITNTGNVDLENIVVTDDLLGTLPDGSIIDQGDGDAGDVLSVGESWTYEMTGTAEAGQYANVSDVVGDDIHTGEQVTDDDPSHYFGAGPAIDIEKATNGEDADDPTGPVVAVGSTVTWTYVVTNTGNVALGNVVVTDDNGTPGDTSDDFNPAFTGGDADNDGLLDLNETWTYRATGVAQPGQYANLSDVEGNPVYDDGRNIPHLPNVVDDDPSHYYGELSAQPGIDIEKYVRGEGTPEHGIIMCKDYAYGKPVELTFEYNGGNAVDTDQPAGKYAVTGTLPTPALTTVEIIASSEKSLSGAVGHSTFFSGLVDLGEEFTLDADNAGGKFKANTYLYIMDPGADLTDLSDNTLLQTVQYHTSCSAPITLGDIVGGVTLTGFWGTNDLGASLSNGSGGIGEDADVPTGPEIPVGGDVFWTYIVTNTGETPLGDVVVTDDNGTSTDDSDDFNPTFVGGDDDGDGLLDLDETWTYEATGVAIPGQYVNWSDVDGNPVDDNGGDIPGLNDVTDEDPAHYITPMPEPHIDIEKYVQTEEPEHGIIMCKDYAYGKPVELTFEYNGGNAVDTDQPAGKYAVTGTLPTPALTTVEIIGSSEKSLSGAVGHSTFFSGLVDLGEEFTLDADNAGGKFGANTYLYIMDPGADLTDLSDNTLLQTVRYHTSCSAPITLGDIVGGVTLTGFWGTNDLGASLNGGAAPYYDADEPTGPEIPVGENALFTYQVTNSGGTELADVTVRDDNQTPANPDDDFSPTPVESGGYNVGDADQDERLDVGEVWEYTATATTVAGQQVNVATVTGTPVDSNGDVIGNDVTDSDPAHWFGVDQPDGGQGLTPGFWKSKKHQKLWEGYDKKDKYADIFGVKAGKKLTLLDALKAKGGGMKALLRHSAAALLNAAHSGVNYAYTEAQIISMVQDAFATGEFEATKDLFEAQNELGGVDAKSL